MGVPLKKHLEVPRVPAGTPDPVLGTSRSVWCDESDALGESETLQPLDAWLVPFARITDAEH